MKVQNLYPEIKQGTVLDKKSSKLLNKEFWEIVEVVSERKKGYCLTHNRIQRIVGAFYELRGWDVYYEVPFSSGGYQPRSVRFDLVADKGKKQVVIEVKDWLDKRDFGQVNYYSNILENNKIKAKLYLATDFISAHNIFDPAMADEIEEIMTRENVGLIFADKRLLVIFDNVQQLIFEEMPLWLMCDEEIK